MSTLFKLEAQLPVCVDDNICWQFPFKQHKAIKLCFLDDHLTKFFIVLTMLWSTEANPQRTRLESDPNVPLSTKSWGSSRKKEKWLIISTSWIWLSVVEQSSFLHNHLLQTTASPPLHSNALQHNSFHSFHLGGFFGNRKLIHTFILGIISKALLLNHFSSWRKLRFFQMRKQTRYFTQMQFFNLTGAFLCPQKGFHVMFSVFLTAAAVQMWRQSHCQEIMFVSKSYGGFQWKKEFTSKARIHGFDWPHKMWKQLLFRCWGQECVLLLRETVAFRYSKQVCDCYRRWRYI